MKIRYLLNQIYYFVTVLFKYSFLLHSLLKWKAFCYYCPRGNAGESLKRIGESFSLCRGVVCLLFGHRWNMGHVFFIILATFTKIYSVRKTAITKLCLDYKTYDHSGLVFSKHLDTISHFMFTAIE